MKSPELLDRLNRAAAQLDHPARLMEVCGTHTHAIGRGGLRALLPSNVDLISGPGCPVCVTAQTDIERMMALSRVPGLTLCTYGDMIRVPGVESSLERERSDGADVRIVYSALDALELAKSEPNREVVFLAVGFETTAPATASVLLKAREQGLRNLSVFATHKLVLPAMEAVLQGNSEIAAFITPGHVSVILGADAYSELSEKYGIPCVVTGFEPPDVLEGIAMLLELLGQGNAGSFIQYKRVVNRGGNAKARAIMDTVFEVSDAEWRGLGVIPDSGLRFRDAFADFDALARFNIGHIPAVELPGCKCGEVLKGLIHPPECPLFRKVCTPRNPIGPCMVSSEGSCAARYKYG